MRGAPKDLRREPPRPAGDVRELPPDWRLPDERSARTRGRLLAILCASLAVWYLQWLLQGRRVGTPELFWMLVAAESFNLLQALGFWWTCANQRIRRPPAAPERSHSVDILIPVYNEPAGVVAPVLAAASRLQGAGTRAWLLDDGRSREMAALAERHGVGYLRRDDRAGAKAGNINRALQRTDAEHVVVLDCDHVPRPELLERTLGYFAEDPRLAYVQTPQYYANHDASPVAAAAAAQQSLFFGPIARGKDGFGAMFCAGTNVVFRRAALQEAGGFPEGSLTEDFELSIGLHERGWRSVYHPEVLACGLGPEDMASYVSQQQRWARGCLSALPSVLRSRLPWRLRAQYVLSATYFLSGWTLLVYMSLPVLRITAGLQPLAATTADQFLLHFAPYYLGALSTVALAGFGTYTYGAFALAAGSFWIHVQATLTALLRRPARFVVTPKQGSTARQPRAVAPALLAIAVLLLTGVYGLIRSRSAATLNNVAFAALHSAVLCTAAAPALLVRRSRRLAPEQPTRAAPARRPWSKLALTAVLAAAVFLPSSLAVVGGSQLGPSPTLSSEAHAAVEGFIRRYVTADGRVVRRDQGGDTVSEGQAYGMLLTVALDDHAGFARVWRWTKANLQTSDGLLAYHWRNGAIVSRQSATDADLEAADALALAAERFRIPAYRGQARRIARAILARESAPSVLGPVLLAGPWAAGEPAVLNASYFSPRAYADLEHVLRDPRWGRLLTTSRRIVADLEHSGHRLPSDWAWLSPGRIPAAAPGPFPGQRGAAASGLDAIRVPIWLAASCHSTERREAASLRRLYSRHPGYIRYTLGGVPVGTAQSAASFVAAAAAAHAAGARAETRRLLARATAFDHAHPTYYGSAWVALGRVLLTSTALGSCPAPVGHAP